MGEFTKKMKQNLTEVLHRVHFVATATDCWTVRNKNFFGLTVDWINSDFERESTALACRRLKSSHTFDVLACATDDIHSEYNINDKVITTTTDNGANFVKAFATFQYETASITNVNLCRKVGESSDNVNEQDNGDDDEENDFSSSMFVEVHFEETDSMLNDSTTFEYKLPRHQRCACHILHLIARKDVVKADSDSSCKRLSRACFGKLSGLWNKAGRSASLAEKVQKCCGMLLVRPIYLLEFTTFSGRKNSSYHFDEKGEADLRQLFSAFQLRV